MRLVRKYFLYTRDIKWEVAKSILRPCHQPVPGMALYSVLVPSVSPHHEFEESSHPGPAKYDKCSLYPVGRVGDLMELNFRGHCALAPQEAH